MHRYEGRSALVTGAGSGMGEAVSLRLAAEGARVAVLDRDAGGGERVAAAICEAGGEAVFIPADVTDAASMQAAVAEVLRRHGGLDVAVNNAGIPGGRGLIPDLALEDWDRTIAVNLTGVFNSLRAELPAMRERGGSVVNMSSITGIIAHPMAAGYVASKHGVIGLTKSAALEWGPMGVRVNAVAPTWVHTPMTEQVFDAARWRALDARHALGRCATMAEVAALVAFLGSDEAGIITGAVYLADGGYTAA